jgi:alpha-tubulin suppressor-like RCC1 family protein
MMRSAVLTAAALGSIALVACNNDTVTGPGFTCDVTNPVQSIVIAPSTGARIVVHTPALDTDTTKVAATATNRFGAVRTDVTIGFSSSDTTVATVDATGTIHAKKPGLATIKASACGESSSTVVTVVANVARVTVTPASDTVLTGDSVVYTGRAFSAGNVLVPGVVFTFSASPASAVTLHQTSDSTVTVIGAAAGSATITATAEGIGASASTLVLARLFVSGTAVVSTFDTGDDLSCGIITLGHGYCWGLNNHGQLGAVADSVCFQSTEASTSATDTTKTAALPCSLSPKALVTSLEFSAVSAGDSSACGISLSGQALCWGKGTHGEIGNGSVGNRATPVVVAAGLNFSAISVGGAHACALTTTNAAYCWGSDSTGQLGDLRQINSTTPIPVVLNGGPATFAGISAGYRHSCGVGADGAGWCWGDNSFGQLGDGTQSSSQAPVQVAGGLSFKAISAGGDHSCGITTSGAAFCWGSNAAGQLGTGSVGDISATPVAVSGGLTFSRISASTGTVTTTPPDSLGVSHRYKQGSGHTCALTTAGAIYCWGDDGDLQLGRGPFSGGANGVGLTPAQVIGGQLPSTVTFVSVSTGSRHSCGVGSDGAAYCWGSNVFGALGNTLQAAFRGLPQRVATPK